MPTQPIKYARIGLSDGLKPLVPPGDDPTAASAVVNYVLMEQRRFSDRLRRFLNGHYNGAPTIAAHAWELSGAMNSGVLEWIRQWPTEAAAIDPDFDAAEQDAIANSALATTKPTGSGLAIPDGDDPETVYEITAYVFRSVRELRAAIRIFANARYTAAPASAEHASDLATSYLRLLAAWALSWPQ
ncbi:hypothetical protein IFM12275_41270 [Nocardia sputorum]|uniref:hypothetical protein n=1 Tax=Nocardia TaxID=1817 RepID=UPI002454443D|nr:MULTISPECIES: hypothetical protein [Nocardia]BDT94151.1 hypothetical protein IFM12275_41270 [Nocardia sputorum]